MKPKQRKKTKYNLPKKKQTKNGKIVIDNNCKYDYRNDVKAMTK